MTVAAVILASTVPIVVPKQLREDGGVPLVRRVTMAATTSSADAVVVITGGPHTARIAHALEGLDFVELRNPRWIEGTAASIRAGVAWADAQGFDAVTLIESDRSRASADHLDALARLHRRGNAIVATRHAEVLGLPACFGRAVFRDLMALLGDRTACDVIRAASEIGVVDWNGEPEAKRSGIRAAIRATRSRAGRS